MVNMKWYYIDGKQNRGPFSRKEFQALIDSGTVKADTYVWRKGFDEWKRYSDAAATGSGVAAAPVDAQGPWSTCSQCGGYFPPQDVLHNGGSTFCVTCKPGIINELKTGAPPMRYGGFWIRFLAKFIDGIITGAVALFSAIVFGILSSAASGYNSIGIILLHYFFIIVFKITYATFFVGKYAATPGKMACNLKVVMADGGVVTYGRAFGRFFAEILSQITLYIGYIIAGFDIEKRALHDHICGTRVIYK